MRIRLKLLWVGLLAVLALAAAASSSAASTNVLDNGQAAQSCLNGGYQDLYTQQGSAFANADACVAYALAGNELVQLKITSIVWPSTGEVPHFDMWGYTFEFSGLWHTTGYEMSWQAHLLPGDAFGGSGGTLNGTAKGGIGGIPCSGGYTAIYVTARTQRGYPVTSRTVPAGCPLGSFQMTGWTRQLTDGGVIISDSSGGHLLTGDASLLAQLLPYAGKQMTVVGSILADPAKQPHYPIRVSDFRLEPGGAFNGQQVSLSGPVRRLSDGGVIVDDSFGHGHRLQASGALRTQVDAAVGHRAVIQGVAVVNNTASRLNWPINVTSIANT